VIPQLHQTWAEAKQHTLSGLEAHQAQLLRRRQRIERQDHRLLDAYQAEILNLPELQTRRQKLAAELHQIAQESRSKQRLRLPIWLALVLALGGMTSIMALVIGISFYVAGFISTSKLVDDLGRSAISQLNETIDSQLQPAADQARFLAHRLEL